MLDLHWLLDHSHDICLLNLHLSNFCHHLYKFHQIHLFHSLWFFPLTWLRATSFAHFLFSYFWWKYAHCYSCEHCYGSIIWPMLPLDTPNFNYYSIIIKSTLQIHYWISQHTELLVSMISLQLVFANCCIQFRALFVIF